jgi:hypothetical protein
VAKCILTAIADGGTPTVQPSDPLDLNSPYAAVPSELADASCLGGYDASVRE